MTAEAVAKGAKPPPKPVIDGKRSVGHNSLIYIFTFLPTALLLGAVPVAWGWGLGWVDVALFIVFYFGTGWGVTIGYHRLFTHGSFKAKKGLKATLAIAGSMAVQGPPITWVADHRRHHAFSDREGDPHSPWLFGTSMSALAKGFWHAHMGWLFKRDQTNKDRFAPDLQKDPVIARINRLFWLWTILTFVLPAILGGLITWSWWGALTALFWAGFVRVGVLHHVTWSTNSICHMIGERPFESRDKAANFWPLAVFSFGESWHNLHHADPTSARHGVLPHQWDSSARLIRWCEKLGWATDVRWPTPSRLAKISAGK